MRASTASAPSTRTTLLIFFCASNFLAGCTDDLESSTDITKNRVIAARFEANGEPTRAWPRLGEEASVTWTVVDEGEPRPLTYALAVCKKLPAGTNPVCAEAPFAVITRSEPSTDDPVVRFVVPADLGESREVLVLGLICAEGWTIVDPQSLEADCVAFEGSEVEPRGTPVVFALPVEQDASNRHPAFEDDFISLSVGELRRTWAAPSEEQVPGTTCANLPESDALPQVSQTNTEPIAFAFSSPASNFESYQESGLELQEALTVSGFSTAGSFERSLTSLSAEAPSGDVEWERPDPSDTMDTVDVSAEGALVAFHFVTRDGRAGAHITRRELCLVP